MISVETLALARKYTDAVSAHASADMTVAVTENVSDAYAKIYTITQGGSEIANINIPKDMVVSSGNVVDDPTGYPKGRYIELVLANSDNTKIYIAVADLVDVYTAQANATQIQLSIDSSKTISASIVAGSVGTTELSLSVNTVLNSVGVHIAATVASESGAHGLRYYNGALQYDNNGTWTNLSIADMFI